MTGRHRKLRTMRKWYAFLTPGTRTRWLGGHFSVQHLQKRKGSNPVVYRGVKQTRWHWRTP